MKVKQMEAIFPPLIGLMAELTGRSGACEGHLNLIMSRTIPNGTV